MTLVPFYTDSTAPERRSRPVCRIVPLDDAGVAPGRVEEDSLYGAGAVGESTDGLTAADHDEFLYGSRGR